MGGGGGGGGGGRTMPSWAFSDTLYTPDLSIDEQSIHNWADSRAASIGEALSWGFDLREMNITAAQSIASHLGADLSAFRLLSVLDGAGSVVKKIGYVGLAVDGVQTLSVLVQDGPWKREDYAQVAGTIFGGLATLLISANPVGATICAGIAIGAQIYEWHVQE